MITWWHEKKRIQHPEFIVFQLGNEAALRKPYSLNTMKQNSVQAANRTVIKEKATTNTKQGCSTSDNPHIFRQTSKQTINVFSFCPLANKLVC